MQLTCSHCGYDWEYKGNSKYYATCPKCLPKGTIVGGPYAPINSIKKGESVLGLGGLGKVLHILKHPYDGRIVTIRASGLIEFSVTPDHLLYVSHLVKGGLTRPHWVQAGRLLERSHLSRGTDHLLLPVNTAYRPAHRSDGLKDTRSGDESQFYSVEMARELGMAYGTEIKRSILSNGSDQRRSLAVHTMWEADLQLLAETEDHTPYFNVRPSGMEDLGESERKVLSIPKGIICSSDACIRESFLKSLISRCETRGNSILIGSNLALGLQLQYMFATLGIFASIERTEHLSHNESGEILTLGPSKGNCIRSRCGFWVPINDVTLNHFSGEVFNLETTDGTFLVSNVVLHNCLYKVKVTTTTKETDDKGSKRRGG
jgi:hypothetical protein